MNDFRLVFAPPTLRAMGAGQRELGTAMSALWLESSPATAEGKAKDNGRASSPAQCQASS